MSKQHYALTVTPLTGIHIGTGEELTPLDYKIADKIGGIDLKKKLYFKFSSDKILKRLIEEGKDLTAFDRASVTGNMKELQRFFQEQCTTLGDTEYPCDITKGFFELYKHNAGKDPYENAARVFQMYRPEGSKKPVIPGSSLKGAIRTALLNYSIDTLSNTEYDILRRDFYEKRMSDPALQKRLFQYQDGKDDPLRCISVSDCPFPAKDSQLVGVLKNISCDKHTGELSGLDKLQIQAEVIRGKLIDGKADGVFTIDIDTDLQRTTIPERFKVRKHISIQEIIDACNRFFWDEFNNEYDRFYKSSVDGATDIIEKLKPALEQESQKKNCCVIRVGRWSQVEFVTFAEDFRQPKTPTIKGKKMNSGTSRTVFEYNGMYVPMGWCLIRLQEP